MNPKTFLAAVLFALSGAAAYAESGFLTDYSLLSTPADATAGDRAYVAPGADERLINISGLMVDEPEIHFSADSEYRGLKAEDVAAIAAILRTNLVEKLTAGGYNIVEEPAPNVVYLRSALTELYLKKKKRGLMSYTPMGAVVKVGKDALTETLEKVDIIEMSLEAELSDSMTGEILGAAALQRGQRKEKGHKEERMDMDELRATVQEYSGRFRCRLDNARTAPEQRIDCHDAAARQAREGG